MLPFHIIYPQKRNECNLEFIHYLSLGSHNSGFNFQPNVFSFSKVMLTPKSSFPKIDLVKLRNKYQNNNFNIKISNFVIALYGEVNVDGKILKNKLSSTQDQIQISQFNYAKNVQYISNSSQNHQNATFFYLIIGQPTKNQQNERKQAKDNGLHQLLQNNSISHIKLLTQIPKISLIMSLKQSQLKINKNSLLYLQRGEIWLMCQQKRVIKNKGNQKGQQNNIDNLIYAAEDIIINIKKDTILFLITQSQPVHK